ncbi:MAG: metallophosphoesterase [Myxococcaceae bacterium]|nr:metallophosphoesterase [Myxococcaceae bacterium]
MRPFAPLLVVGLAACLEPASDRAERDLDLGAVKVADYDFASDEGLLHVREATAQRLRLRASCAEVSFSLTRRSSGIDELFVEVSNVLPSFELASTPGVLSFDGSPVRGTPTGAPLTSRWRLQFPPGVERVELATPPRSGDFTFLAFGDIQNGIRTFADVVAKLNEHPDAEHIIFLGDLTESSLPEEFDAVEASFAQVVMPVFATPGNHDVMENTLYQRRFGRTSYSCVNRGVRFTAVDSSSATLAPALWPRYHTWLEQGRDQRHVLFSHIPSTEVLGVRAGQWSSRAEARRFIGDAVEAGADLVLFGHIHSFDAYALGGIPTYIAGGGGAIPERFDGIDRHFLKVRVAADNLEVEVVRVDP